MSFGFGFGFPRRAAAGGAAPSLNFDFTSLTSLPSRITFSRTSNATLTDSNGRVSYAPHNLLTNSEAFETWVKSSSTVTSNAVVAEDGTTTGDTVVSAAATAITGVYTGATFAAGTYTQSIYVKQATNVRYVQLLWTSGVVSNEWANFDLQTGTLTGGTYTGATIVAARNGWYRLTLTSVATASAGDGLWIIAVSSGSAGRGATYPGNGTDSFSVWGAQLNVANAPVNLAKSIGGAGSAPVVTANAAVAPDGTLTAERVLFNCGGSTIADRSSLTQAVTGVSVGQSYVGTVWIKANTPGDIGKQLRFVGDSVLNSTIVTLTADWQRVSASGTCTLAVNNNFIIETRGTFTTNQTADVLIWGAQLNTGSTALPYVATTSSIYLPPSYNSTTPKNLLGFTQEFDNAAWTKSNSFVQTNLFTYSQDFSNAFWQPTNITVTNSATTAPDGTNTAQSIAATAAVSTLLVSAATTVSATSATYSIYVKQGSGANLANTTATNLLGGTINYSTGVFTYSVGSTGVTVQNAGNGWWRIVLSVTSGITAGDGLRGYIGFTGGTETAGTFLYAWGAQLVQGSVPGDYQVTTSAAAAVQYSDPNGTRTADKLVEDTAAAVHWAGQAVTTVVAPYTFSVRLKPGERTFALLYHNESGAGRVFDLTNCVIGGTAGLATPVSSNATSAGGGWCVCSITVNATAASNSFRVYTMQNSTTYNYTGDGTSGIYIWGAQLSNSASVDPYVYNPQAAPTSTAYYGPRFDYNPVTLAANGLLIEQQSTNVLLQSENFSAASWSKSGITLTPSVIVAPNGSVSASQVTATASGYILQTSTAVNGANATVSSSIYIRNVDCISTDTLTINMSDGVVGSVGMTFKPFDGSFTPVAAASWSNISRNVTNVGNGWWRITLSGTTTQWTSGWLEVANGGFGRSYALWGAQLEAGSFATSYIPTVASQVTRAADNASMLGDNFATWYNQTQGTLATTWNITASISSATAVEVSDASANNRFNIQPNTGGTTRHLGFVSGVAQIVVDIAGAATGVSKDAFAYASGDFAASRNASAVATSSYAGLPIGIKQMNIGNTIGANYINGTIRSISYYPTRLPNATLQSITA
jgi:hypothetical protein